MNEAKKFLDNLLNNNDTIVVGVSGGPDSMCLLSLLKSLAKKYHLKIVCAHVNHGIRKESDKEKEFVENYCVINNIIFEYYKIEEYKNNKFTESDGRNKRYAFFKQLVTKYQAEYLMTAHHAGDLAETILMRIVRGSNLKGYIGIPKISTNDNYSIVRPLLSATKKDILEYLDKNNIQYVIDKSNDSDKYTRNRFRKQVLPLLEKEQKDIYKKFNKYSSELLSYYEYVRSIVKEKIKYIYKDGKINIEKFLQEEEFIQHRILEYIIEDIQKYDIFDISDKQIEEIFKLIKNRGNKQINLNNNYIARISYNYLILEKNKNVESYEYILDKDLKVNEYKITFIKNSLEKSNNVIRLDSKEIALPLKVRTMQDGDIMAVKNLKGHQKVKDIFINAKIDLKKRKGFPLIVDSKNTIIWIPSVKKSTFDKEISEKCDIILKCTEEKYE